MHYTDGKSRTNLDKVKEIEKVYGINMLSPFGTNHPEVFEEKIANMNIEQLNGIARKVGAPSYADEEQQKEILRQQFKHWSIENPPSYDIHKSKQAKLDMRKNASKRAAKALDYARTKSVFELDFPEDSLNSFLERLKTYDLADLQNLAAKCGFNPTFDRGKIIFALKKEFERDINSRP
jgi:hypothetical protein